MSHKGNDFKKAADSTSNDQQMDNSETEAEAELKYQLSLIRKWATQRRVISSVDDLDPELRKVIEESQNKKKPANNERNPSTLPRRRIFATTRVDSSFVQSPARIITEPRDLRKDENLDVGRASEIISAIFPRREFEDFCAFHDRDYYAHHSIGKPFQEQRLQEILDHPSSTSGACLRLKRRKILESLRCTLQLVHAKKSDKLLEMMCDMMRRMSYFKWNGENPMTMARKTPYSWFLREKSEKCTFPGQSGLLMIPRQRKTHLTVLRPVFIDGLNFSKSFPHESPENLPKIPMAGLLEILLQFTLDGHKTQIFLPHSYLENTEEKVDDISAFQILLAENLIRFSENPESLKVEVLEAAEKTHGILVTRQKNVQFEESILAFPAINRYSKFADQIVVSIDFSRNPDQLLSDGELSDPETNVSDDSGQRNNDPSSRRRRRTYSRREMAQIDVLDHQLTLEDQILLLSHLSNVAEIRFLSQQRIRLFLRMIQRWFPDVLPNFMRENALETVETALERLNNGEDLEIWPISAGI